MKKLMLAHGFLVVSSACLAATFDITVDGYAEGKSALADFPLPVRLSTAANGFDPSAISEGQLNLVFEDADGKELPYDVDTWNPEGESLVWVKVPSLAHGTTLTVRYGTDVTRTAAAKDVWTGYAAVWHLGEDSGTAADAAGNGFEATPSGESAAGMVGVAGKFGLGRRNSVKTCNRTLNNENQNGADAYLATTKNYAGYNTSGQLTFSGWYRADDLPASQVKIPLFTTKQEKYDEAKGVDCVFRGWGETGKTDIYVYGNNARLEKGTFSYADWLGGWFKLTFVFDGSEMRVYRNGELFASKTGAAIADPDSSETIWLNGGLTTSGYYGSFYGDCDELRLMRTAASADWVAAAYAAETDPKFLSYGAISGLPPVDPPDPPTPPTPPSAPNFKTCFRLPLTVDGAPSGETLVDFPVLVRLAETENGFSYADLADAVTGSDLFFALPDGTVLAHEIDTWANGGTSLVWVKVPSLTQGTVIYACYGDGEVAVTKPAATSVWSDFTGVWHMSEKSGAVADATGHGLTAADYGTQGARTGVVGNARQNATSNGTGTCLLIPNYDSYHLGGDFTFSGWFKGDDCVSWVRLFSRKTDYNLQGWSWEQNNGSRTQAYLRGDWDSRAAFVNHPDFCDDWLHLTLVFTGKDRVLVYQNGVLNADASVLDNIWMPTDNGQPLSLGCDADRNENHLNGKYDECRLTDAVRSAAWVAAEYATVKDAAFVSFGTVVPPKTDPVYDDYAEHVKFRIVTPVSGATDVPTLLKLSEGRGGFSYEKMSFGATGADLFLSDANGNRLDYDIEKWAEGGVSLVWVRLPTVTASEEIIVSYGGPAVPAPEKDLWGDYTAVWHFQEAGEVFADATGHGHAAADAGVEGRTAGTMNGGLLISTDLPGGEDYRFVEVPASVAPAHRSAFTVEGWLRYLPGQTPHNDVLLTTKLNDKEAAGWELALAENTTDLVIRGGSADAMVVPAFANLADGRWHMLAVAFDGSAVKVYTDGALVHTGSLVASPTDSERGMRFGCSFDGLASTFKGEIDEFRLASGVLSADRIQTDYLVVSTAGGILKPVEVKGTLIILR